MQVLDIEFPKLLPLELVLWDIYIYIYIYIYTSKKHPANKSKAKSPCYYNVSILLSIWSHRLHCISAKKMSTNSWFWYGLVLVS